MQVYRDEADMLAQALHTAHDIDGGNDLFRREWFEGVKRGWERRCGVGCLLLAGHDMFLPFSA